MERPNDEPPDRSQSEASDVDSDLEELQGDIAKFDESVREFLESRQDTTNTTLVVRGGARGRGARGPRKAAKPRGDITARLSKVNQAFLSGDYDQALDLAFEVIRINAETHQAWTALSSIFRERGELDRALSAMVYAAHLRPKDVSGWLQCASFALEAPPDEGPTNLQTARLCYSAALRADPTNVAARLGKAAVCHQQGHLSAAISEYKLVLKHRPYDLEIIRKLAEACIDSKNALAFIPSAVEAYRKYFDFVIDSESIQDLDPLWSDVAIYIELFALAGMYQDGIRELKSLSRWMLGQSAESYWDDWQLDDREWDTDDRRKSEVRQYDLNLQSSASRASLPLDMRVRLATYRLKLGNLPEAMNHLHFLDYEEERTKVFAGDFPFLVYDLGVELLQCDQPIIAAQYFELLRELPGDPDASVLLQLGRCRLATGEQAIAEELYLAALDVDEDNIDARIELANMYEKAREDEEALILAAEAMALRGVQSTPDIAPLHTHSRESGKKAKVADRHYRRPIRKKKSTVTDSAAISRSAPVIPRRYRPKRLAGPDKRRQEEQARALKLSRQYEVVRDLRQKITGGQEDLIPLWKTSSKELIDDFRSLKRFYTWDKYLHFLGPSALSMQSGHEPNTELSQMYERLTKSIAPHDGLQSQGTLLQGFNTHQGISFDDWLNLFLDYAIQLAIEQHRHEAYQVCEAAKDSTVFQTSKHVFTIYVAWSVCAIYTNDEERCVTIARHLMRDGATSDSYRLFALLSKLCQSPVSWYTSGPAQKYILRQIKSIDANHETALKQSTLPNEIHHGSSVELRIDICLLMLYGHILYTSTSYAYALGYFLRARSLDPCNSMVNLSLGLSYVHYGLKRQSTNRQYLLLQGQAFLAQYAQPLPEENSYSIAERYYNMGRMFQLLGINHLCLKYYAHALDFCKNGIALKDLSSIILANTVISLLSVGNDDVAFSILKGNLRL